jgi:hypothetical protein
LPPNSVRTAHHAKNSLGTRRRLFGKFFSGEIFLGRGAHFSRVDVH